MNRQKAANALRGYAETHGRYDPFWCVKDAVFGDAQAHPVGEVLSTLADLIDPTCEVESVDSTGGLLAYRLSCGHTAYRPAYIQGPPPVCPNCGARVTRVGER